MPFKEKHERIYLSRDRWSGFFLGYFGSPFW